MSTQAAALRALSRRTDPADPGAQNNLGVLLLARGLRDDATAAFARALELDPQMRVARENFSAAADPAWRERRAAELRARLRVDGADTEARRELARLAASLGRFDDARAHLDALVAVRPHDAGAFVLRGLCEQAAGELDAAVAWLERAIAAEPRSAVAHAHLGEVLYHRGEPARAIAALDRAVALAPDHADAHYVRGFVLGELGRHDDAAEATHRALRLNPALGRAQANLAASGVGSDDRPTSPHSLEPVRAANEVEAHVALGVAFRQKGYFDEALREYRRALARGADEGATARAMAELHLLRGAAAEAAPLWARVCELAPADAAAWNARGVASHLSGDHVGAAAAYARAVAIAHPGDPAGAWAQNNLGVAQAGAGDAPAAAASFARAVAADGTLLAARLNLAQTLAATGAPARALAEYREALRAAPSSADAWAGVGAILAAAGRHAEARTAFGRAVEADPSRADSRYRMAFEAAALGEHDAARREVEQALAVTPYVAERPLALALDLGQPVALGVSVDVRATGDAVAGFDVAPGAIDALLVDALAPADAESAAPAGAPYAVAEECLRAGLYDRAAAAVSGALARGADRAEGLAILGDAFARQGYFGEALERYQESREAGPSHRRAAVGEVRMLRELGRRIAAWEAAEAAGARWDGDAECLALAAAARADAGDADAAVDALARAAALADGAAVWQTIAGVWRAIGDHRAAAGACRRALAAEPGRPELRLALARALAAAGEGDAAHRELTALVHDAPGFGEARMELAALARERGDARSAAAHLVAALEGDPYHLDALAELAELLVDAGRGDDARVAVERVLRFDPEHARALAVEGDLLAAAARHDEARACWDRAVALEPAGEGARRARARLVVTVPEAWL